MLRWKHSHAAGCVLALAMAAGCASKAEEPKSAGPPRSPTYPQPYHLFPLLNLSNPLLPETAALLDKTVNDDEREAAGRKLVQLARTIDSKAWRDQQRFTVVRLHGSIPTPRLEQKMLDDLTRRYQVRVYDAMGALGGEAVLDHCADVVEDDDLRQAEKQLAIAVLAAHDRAELTAPTPAVPAGGAVASTGQTGATASFSAPPEVQGGQIIDTARVMDALRPYFVVCYERSLAQHGRFGAWIALQADVSAQDGRVYAVGGKGDDGVPPQMMQCLYSVLQQAQFSPPRGGNARISLSLSFTPPAGSAPSSR